MAKILETTYTLDNSIDPESLHLDKNNSYRGWFPDFCEEEDSELDVRDVTRVAGVVATSLSLLATEDRLRFENDGRRPHRVAMSLAPGMGTTKVLKDRPIIVTGG